MMDDKEKEEKEEEEAKEYKTQLTIAMIDTKHTRTGTRRRRKKKGNIVLWRHGPEGNRGPGAGWPSWNLKGLPNKASAVQPSRRGTPDTRAPKYKASQACPLSRP